jgi:hypothetical protein
MPRTSRPPAVGVEAPQGPSDSQKLLSHGVNRSRKPHFVNQGSNRLGPKLCAVLFVGGWSTHKPLAQVKSWLLDVGMMRDLFSVLEDRSSNRIS